MAAGADAMKVNVVANRPIERSAPIAESFGDQNRARISRPIEISSIPSRVEKVRTEKIP